MSEFKLIIVPDEEEDGAAEVFVDGTIGGRPYRFLLDTGAARSSVALDEYTSTFGSIEKSDLSGVFAKMSDDLITVPTIELGPITRRDFTLVRIGAEKIHASNLIGMDLLKDFRCHFQFNQNRVLLDANDADNFAFQPLFLDQKFHPYVEVQFETSNAKAVWDTGASLTIVDTNFIRKHPAFFEEAGQSTGTDAAGVQMETPMFIMSTVMIGSQHFPPQRVAGVDLSFVNSTIEVPMDLILGYNTLCKANWIFDYPRRQWVISKWLVSKCKTETHL